jgi:hypothetical protein
MGLAQYWRRRQVRIATKIMNAAVRQGWNPLETLQGLIQAECGFPPFAHETIMDYAARAVGVSRDMADRYTERVNRGEKPLPEMAAIHGLMERIGRKIKEG